MAFYLGNSFHLTGGIIGLYVGDSVKKKLQRSRGFVTWLCDGDESFVM